MSTVAKMEDHQANKHHSSRHWSLIFHKTGINLYEILATYITRTKMDQKARKLGEVTPGTNLGEVDAKPVCFVQGRRN